MTISELWRHYDNMMEKAAHLERLLADMEFERQDFFVEAESTLRTIDDIQGERDGEVVPTPRPASLLHLAHRSCT